MPAQTVIQVRRDSAANWESVDPTLAAGEIGFDTTNNQIKIGNGTDEWTVLDYASGGGASVQVSETAPANPEVGNVWYNSTEGTSYIYYDSYWVPLTPAIVGPEGPEGPAGATGPEGPQGEPGTPGVGIPSQTGNAGELLVTDGTNASWSNTITGNSSNIPFIVKQNGSETANLQQWRLSDDSVVASITDGGSASFIGNVTARGDVNIGVGATSGTTRTIAFAANSSFPNTASSTITASGGTSTPGQGSLTFSASGGATFTGLLTANPAVPTAANSAKAVGFIGMPQNAPAISGTYTYTFGLGDAGEHFYATGTPTSATLTIPANGTTAFEIGTTIVVINDFGAATNLSIAINTDTLVLAGTGATGTRTLARYGMATLVKVTATRWIISGNGLT